MTGNSQAFTKTHSFPAFFSLPNCLNGSARHAGLPPVLKDGKESIEFHKRFRLTISSAKWRNEEKIGNMILKIVEPSLSTL